MLVSIMITNPVKSEIGTGEGAWFKEISKNDRQTYKNILAPYQQWLTFWGNQTENCTKGLKFSQF